MQSVTADRLRSRALRSERQVADAAFVRRVLFHYVVKAPVTMACAANTAGASTAPMKSIFRT